MRIIILAGLLLVGCATDGMYRAPQGGLNCIPGKKMTRGNCGLARSPIPVSEEQHQPNPFGAREGAPCNSEFDCQLGQLCRKGNGNMNPGICINRN